MPPPELEHLEAEDVIRWTLEHWHPRAAVCTAFQAEGMVILDMARRIRPDVRVITLDTGRLPAETHEFIDTVRHRYGIDVEIFFPEARRVEAMVRRCGPNSFRNSVEERKRCCQVRKVEVLERALSGLDAWMTGLRRDQTRGRAATRKVEIDPRHGGILKVSPLADWSQERVWAYTEEHDVPVHPLYAEGYTSLGCAPCTRATVAGEDPRAGRWWWEDGAVKECGIHLAAGSGAPRLVRLGRRTTA